MSFLSARVLVTLVAVACAVSVGALFAGERLAAGTAKIAASSGFIALALRVGALRSAYGRFVLAGLGFSWLGDALLISLNQRLFLLGLTAFLTAHLAYIGAFLWRGIDARWAAAAAPPVIAIAAAVAIWLWPHATAELEIPVRAYLAAISVMVVCAVGTYGRRTELLIPVGAVLFFLSDLSVAALRLAETTMPAYLWGLPMYFAAQVCLAVSTSQSRSQGGTPANRSARKSISARTR